MSQNIRLDRVWIAARVRADAALDACDDVLIAPLPETCPFSLDELAADTFDLDAAVGRLRAPQPPPA